MHGEVAEVVDVLLEERLRFRRQPPLSQLLLVQEGQALLLVLPVEMVELHRLEHFFLLLEDLLGITGQVLLREVVEELEAAELAQWD